MEHTLSIIIPIYNAEKYLSCCVQSILNQTYKNFELLLVDDGSTDESGNICDNFGESDSRVKVIHKPNGGCSSARNLGIENAEGDLIAFVDADDFLDEQMYEILIRNMDETGAEVSACTYEKVYDPSQMKSNYYEKIPLPIVFRGGKVSMRA